VHLHPYYRETYGYREGDLPRAEDFGARTLSLPLSSRLSEADVEDVIAAVHRAVGVAAGADVA
jgi:dTDP-4-amino-4,6-dideoxygalactose transaminase